jgi:Spy/CpxP family protein refolding chaperone
VNQANRFKAIFYALALLVFGGVIGVMIRSATSTNPQTLRIGRTDEIATVIRDRLNAKLDLTADQKQRIEPMIKKAAEEMEASHLDSLKRANKAVDDLHAQIRPELIPEQRQKLLESEAERSERMWEKYHYRPTVAVTNLSQH